MQLILALALLGQTVDPLFVDGISAPANPSCPKGATCLNGLKARDLIAVSENLIAYKKYDEAAQVLASLDGEESVAVERGFLEGYIARRKGDWKTAIRKFRSVLDQKPNESRVRFELAQALYENGSKQAADYHFKLAQRDLAEAPEDVQRVISGYRQRIRAEKGWSFSTSVGFAPDSNINSATNNTVIDIFGLPFELNDDARSKTGVGQIFGTQGQARIKLSSIYDLDVIGAANMTNYKGKEFDDLGGTLSVGPSRQFGDNLRLGIGATVSQRWYGGKVLNRGVGGRLSADYRFSNASDVSAELSYRKTNNLLSNAYDGNQLALSVTYQQAFKHQVSGSVGAVVQRNGFNDPGNTNWDLGLFAGAGAELPFGINAGVSGFVSSSLYQAPNILFFKTRQDLRLNGRAYLGLRSLRFMGFSPSVDYTYQYNKSNIDLYNYDRHRIEFAIARYF
jgi:outer membrane protein